MSYTQYTYKKNGYFAGMPIGSLVGFNSATIPSGWIKCDGAAVSNSTGLYNNLINLGIGSGTVNAGNYTPPNYTDCIMMAVGTGVTTAIGKTGGTNNASLWEIHIPQHTHKLSQFSVASHRHTYKDYFNTGTGGSVANWQAGTPPGTTIDSRVYQGNTGGAAQNTIYTENTVLPSHTHTIELGYIGSANILNIDVTNPSIAVFFILKYK